MSHYQEELQMFQSFNRALSWGYEACILAVIYNTVNVFVALYSISDHNFISKDNVDQL